MYRIRIRKLRYIGILTLIGCCLLYLFMPCSFIICSNNEKKNFIILPYQDFGDKESEKICKYLNFSTSPMTLDIKGSPQLGTEGPYAVVYNYIEREIKFGVNDTVTYSTHCTPDFTKYVEELSIRWDGPISVAVYVPRYDFCSTLAQIGKLRACANPTVKQKVSWHLYWPKEFPPFHNLRNLPVDPVDCSREIPMPSKSWHTKMVLPYPINVGRNVARQASVTTYVLPSDVELFPSQNLTNKFITFIKNFSVEISKHAKLKKNRHFIYVIPVFEVKSVIPQNKKLLVKQIATGDAVYFHQHVCPHCQKFPGLKKWIHNVGTSNKIRTFAVVKRHYPYHRWEPIYISTKDEPFYDERLSWEGLQDKMSQMHELCLLDYNLVILDQAFLVHSPGIKKSSKQKSDPLDKLRKSFQTRNAQIYDTIMSELQTKYGVNIKCRKH